MRRGPDDEAEKLMLFSLRLQIPTIFHQPLTEMAAEVGRPMVTVARIILVDGIRRWIARAGKFNSAKLRKLDCERAVCALFF